MLTVLFVAAAAHGAFSQTTNLGLFPLHVFDPATESGWPVAGLVQGSDGYFYGTTSGEAGDQNGSVFRINATGTEFTVLHVFNGTTDGGLPTSGLVEDRNNPGLFFGTTTCGGGSTDCWGDSVGTGTIYSVDTRGGLNAFATEHVFAGGAEGTSPYAGLVQASDGNFYGTTWCDGSATTQCLAWVLGDDALDPGAGTIFRWSRAGGLVPLHAFNGAGNGGQPLTNLIQGRDGNLYGVTPSAGANGVGTLFRIQTTGAGFTVLHSFTGADGAEASGALVEDANTQGLFYGTTEFGGAHGFGTVFEFNASSRVLTKLHDFTGLDDGGNPYAGLAIGRGGLIYGTSFYPSTYFTRTTGTVFRLDPKSLAFSTVYTFVGDIDGQNPAGQLVQVNDSLAPGFTGSLFGTTMLGPVTLAADNSIADYGSGAVFRFTPPPALACPASVVTTATSLAGAPVTLDSTLFDPANTATTVTWKVDGSPVQTDPVPPAASSSSSTATPLQFVHTYAADPVGVHTVLISSIDSLNLTASCTLTVEIDKRSQTISFPPIADPTFGAAPIALSGTATSGDPVSFQVVSGPGMLSGNMLTLTGAGTIVVSATQAGDAEYLAAPPVQQTVTVQKAASTVTITGAGTFTYSGQPHAVVATATGVAGAPLTPVSVTYNGSTQTPVAAGTYAVVATFAGDANYLSSSAKATVTINRAPLTIAALPALRTYGQPNPPFAASYSGFVNGEGASVLSGALSFTTSATISSPPGAYPVTPGGVSSPNYTITFVPGILTVLDVPPVAVNDTATTYVATPVAIPVLANDTGIGTLTIGAVSTPGRGTAVISGQSIVYTASGSTPGTDSFTYTVTDGFGGAATATVTVTINNGNPLGHFVVFSNDFTWLRARTVVTAGDVGANARRSHDRRRHEDEDDGDADDITVRLDEGVVMQQASSRVVGDTVALGPHSSVYGLIDNFLINYRGTVLGSTVSPMAVPFMSLPVPLAVAPGRQDVNVTRNRSLTLAAGNYGRVHVTNGATLTLTGGLYQIASLDVDQMATVIFHGAVDLRIDGTLDADAAARLIVDPSVAGLRASQVLISVLNGDDDRCHNRQTDAFDNDFGGPAAVNIGERAVVQANIYAPNGTLWLKSRVQATGAFVAGRVRVGSGVTLTLDSAFN
ncbi:MAG TPA: choice-of-anchor tandem repeat GloVer-containing protein [Vicinamibacterales bacterium]|nr:choice-of-anchor tandem repeat GloVer-containing protein [Vicinamibacterales bacterium]